MQQLNLVETICATLSSVGMLVLVSWGMWQTYLGLRDFFQAAARREPEQEREPDYRRRLQRRLIQDHCNRNCGDDDEQ